MEAMWTRFLPLYKKLQEIIADGAIGDVKFTSAFFGFPAPFADTHRLIAKNLGGGSLLDQGVYTITFADIFFKGALPTRIDARGVLLPNGVDGTTLVTLEFGEDRIAQANSSIALGLGSEAFIGGTKGHVHVHGSFWDADKADLMVYSTGHVPEISHISGGKIGAGYSHMISQVSADVLAGKTQSDIHPISNTIRTQGYFDQILAQLGVDYGA